MENLDFFVLKKCVKNISVKNFRVKILVLRYGPNYDS